MPLEIVFLKPRNRSRLRPSPLPPSRHVKESTFDTNGTSTERNWLEKFRNLKLEGPSVPLQRHPSPLQGHWSEVIQKPLIGLKPSILIKKSVVLA